MAELHTENVARGSKLSFQNVGGGKSIHKVLTFQKSRRGRGPLASPTNKAVSGIQAFFVILCLVTQLIQVDFLVAFSPEISL